MCRSATTVNSRALQAMSLASLLAQTRMLLKNTRMERATLETDGPAPAKDEGTASLTPVTSSSSSTFAAGSFAPEPSACTAALLVLSGCRDREEFSVSNEASKSESSVYAAKVLEHGRALALAREARGIHITYSSGCASDEIDDYAPRAFAVYWLCRAYSRMTPAEACRLWDKNLWKGM